MIACELDFEQGDYVRSKQNTSLTGQVIGERNWGDEYLVRLTDGVSTVWYQAVELEYDGPDDGEYGGNVIPFKMPAADKAEKGIA